VLLNIILDIILLLGAVALLSVGLRRGFLRMVLSSVALLLAVAIAAFIATPLVNTVVSASNGSDYSTPVGIVFTALLLFLYALLEVLMRNTFPETRILALGSFDNVLGAIFGVFWTLLVLALFVLVTGYMVGALAGGGGQGGFLAPWIANSGLVDLLREFFKLATSVIGILFPSGLPQPLAYFVSG
jgi:uncharacterized membrane protein required for colicin V production